MSLPLHGQSSSEPSVVLLIRDIVMRHIVNLVECGDDARLEEWSDYALSAAQEIDRKLLLHRESGSK